mgnify:CR=1 FL=1
MAHSSHLVKYHIATMIEITVIIILNQNITLARNVCLVLALLLVPAPAIANGTAIHAGQKSSLISSLFFIYLYKYNK